MLRNYGDPPLQVDKLRILTNNPTPSPTSFMRPGGFPSSIAEYEFFYETKSAYGFRCPNGTVRYVEAINYFWECLAILRHKTALKDDSVAGQALQVAKSIQCTDRTFNELFEECILIEIEDRMEDYRAARSK